MTSVKYSGDSVWISSPSALAAAERIAVRRGLLDHDEADLAAGARAIVHCELLAQPLADLLPDEAHQRVAAVTGRGGDDDADRAVGIALGCGASRKKRRSRKE